MSVLEIFGIVLCIPFAICLAILMVGAVISLIAEIIEWFMSDTNADDKIAVATVTFFLIGGTIFATARVDRLQRESNSIAPINTEVEVR